MAAAFEGDLNACRTKVIRLSQVSSPPVVPDCNRICTACDPFVDRCAEERRCRNSGLPVDATAAALVQQQGLRLQRAAFADAFDMVFRIGLVRGA